MFLEEKNWLFFISLLIFNHNPMISLNNSGRLSYCSAEEQDLWTNHAILSGLHTKFQPILHHRSSLHTNSIHLNNASWRKPRYRLDWCLLSSALIACLSICGLLPYILGNQSSGLKYHTEQLIFSPGTSQSPASLYVYFIVHVNGRLNLWPCFCLWPSKRVCSAAWLVAVLTNLD